MLADKYPSGGISSWHTPVTTVKIVTFDIVSLSLLTITNISLQTHPTCYIPGSPTSDQMVNVLCFSHIHFSHI